MGDAQDDVLPLGKAGQNPFKKDKIVSKFDVNDIRKVEFVGSYDDKEEIWPRVSCILRVSYLVTWLDGPGGGEVRMGTGPQDADFFSSPIRM